MKSFDLETFEISYRGALDNSYSANTTINVGILNIFESIRREEAYRYIMIREQFTFKILHSKKFHL